ncbi:MAG: helix-turn-helix transcriptional regulator [Clostridia bacterium]|nr:helix-turn-helix transcriptional regulator [Clostridia bacterium]
MKSIGQVIRELRKQKNITQEELADLIYVTPQAISKWEREVGYPDLSQIVPIARAFGISTDVLFDMVGRDADEEALKIINKSYEMRKYGILDTYLEAYDIVADGLKSYPNNLFLLNESVNLGISLALPQNGWLYCKERADKISDETEKRAKQIITYSKNMTDTLRASEILVFIYLSKKDYDSAFVEAENFPERSDFTLFSHMAYIHETMGDYRNEIKNLCANNDYILQALSDSVIRLGKSYINIGRYEEAIEILERTTDAFDMMFNGRYLPSYHDFDSGDTYIILADAYLRMNNVEKAVENMEKSINYHIELYSNSSLSNEALQSPFIKEYRKYYKLEKNAMLVKLREKLFDPRFESLKDNISYKKLIDKIEQIK